MKRILFALSLTLLTISLYAQSTPTEETTTSSEWDGRIKTETTTKYNGDKVKTEQTVVVSVYIDQKISNKKTTTNLFDSTGVVVNERFEENRYNFATGDTKVINKTTRQLVLASMVLTDERLEDFDKSTKTITKNEYSQVNGKLISSTLCQFSSAKLDNCNVIKYFEKSGLVESDTTYSYEFLEKSILSVKITATKRKGDKTDDSRTYYSKNGVLDEYVFKSGTKLKEKEQEEEIKFVVELPDLVEKD